MSSPQYKLQHLRPTPPVNIDFKDLSYSVPLGKKECKLILKNVSGQFRSGQLTGILGPSGSGKTTLLNILAGYKFQQTTGTILINGESREQDKFRKVSRYIMQENCIQPLLSVKESMMIAASLKLGQDTHEPVKLKIIFEILDLLGLSAAEDTHTDKLSGGELKRLFIALELISNPGVLFLDEPTSGLDDVAAYQCIVLLKKLAETGKTIICSIHAPSARLFSCFDSSYFISDGQCVYQGCGTQLVSYLSSVEAPCPVQFNPVDYILELCSGDYGDLEQKMVSVIKNGGNLYKNEACVPIEEIEDKVPVAEASNLKNTFWKEFKVLTLRLWLLQWKNKRYLLIKVLSSLILGVLIGTLYINMGQDPTKTPHNYGFYFACIILFMYVPMMPILLQVPTEMKYLKREHFNGWYKLKSFFSALAVSTLVDQLIFGAFFLTTIYVLTAQPLEFYRIVGFYGMCFLISNISEAYALVFASHMNVTNAAFFGSLFMMPFTVMATFGRGEEFSTLPLTWKILMYSSYLRYGFEALAVIMLSGRKLKCPEDVDFCLYANQDYFLKLMAMDQVVIWIDFAVLVVFLIVVKWASYYFLKQRLRPNKIFKYIKGHVKIKIGV